MAMRSFFHNLNRIICPTIGRIWWRSISSSRQSSPPNKISRRPGLHLKDLICGLPFSRGSATTVLQNWVDEGRKVLVSELRRISRQLMSRRRYKHAFEIITWMEVHNGYSISATDHGMKLELIIKMGNLKEGEEYFANMPYVSQKAGYLILLRSYVKEKDTEKAEALMVRMSGLGLTVNPHPFNEMMKLYMATSQFGKVPSVILEMKQKNILRNVLSYNLWICACYQVSGVASAEMVYKEMRHDKDVEVGWSTLSTLADIYLKSGFLEKAKLALQNAERKLSTTKRLGYFFLITLYASAENKDGVLRLWESSKAVEGKITSANYMCILLCLVKLGDIGEAEKILMQYESECSKYDIRVSNVLLGAYMRNGLMEKAESLHNRTLEKGGSPNYKTWEILMEGWVRSQNMDKAIDAMKKGFALLKQCDWRPSPTIVVAIADFFQKSGNFEDAKHYLKVTRRFGLANLSVYKSLLRMHASTQQPVQEIFRMMEEDGIEIDDETSALLQPFKISVYKLSMKLIEERGEEVNQAAAKADVFLRAHKDTLNTWLAEISSQEKLNMARRPKQHY